MRRMQRAAKREVSSTRLLPDGCHHPSPPPIPSIFRRCDGIMGQTRRRTRRTSRDASLASRRARAQDRSPSPDFSPDFSRLLDTVEGGDRIGEGSNHDEKRTRRARRAHHEDCPLRTDRALSLALSPRTDRALSLALSPRTDRARSFLALSPHTDRTRSLSLSRRAPTARVCSRSLAAHRSRALALALSPRIDRALSRRP